jgi:hypothetical protein
MIICMTGMHRSGTSLMASYFQVCGIQMGKKLVGPRPSNPQGHFEDLDFVELHKKILRSNKCKAFTFRKNLHIRSDQIMQAKKFLEERCEIWDIWGWKDPRTSLFLNLWDEIAQELNQDIKYVFIYRDPYLVIDSLFRRGDRFTRSKPWRSAISWLRYNTELLQFYQKNSKRCVIINIRGVTHNAELGVKKLGEWLGYRLDQPFTTVYHSKELATQELAQKGFYVNTIKFFFGKTLRKVFASLEKNAFISSGN